MRKIEPICRAFPHLQAEARVRASNTQAKENLHGNQETQKGEEAPSHQAAEIQCDRQRLYGRWRRQRVVDDRDLVTPAGVPAAPACIPQNWKCRASTKKISAGALDTWTRRIIGNSNPHVRLELPVQTVDATPSNQVLRK
jgi:hypothetical protein